MFKTHAIPWRDLTGLTWIESAKELLLPVPPLLASLYLASRGHYVIAMALSFIFFLAGLRLAHDAYHYNLGLPRLGTESVMGVLSVLMLGSMHAVQFNHLRHHAFCMQDDDIEALSARMSWLGALLWGPVFPLRIHRHAMRFAKPRQQRWIHWELVANAAWIVLVLAVLRTPVLKYHLAAMALGQCLTAFFAVWTVHHDCKDSDYFARTIRDRLKSAIALHMFFHAEHHLYPRVPTCHLPLLARRLDEGVPGIRLKQVY